MRAKKNFLLITSIVLLVVMTCCLFAGCKSAEEKEAAYYDKAAAAVEKTVGTLDTLTSDTNLFGKAWTSSFMYAYTYYGIEEKGVITPNTVTRGTDKATGWTAGSEQFVHFMYIEVDFTNVNNYTVKTTLFKDIDRGTYYSYKDKPKKYATKFTKIGEQLTYTVADGEASGELGLDFFGEEFNPIDFIKANTNKDFITDNGISASDHFRIYTRFMRIDSRQVFDELGSVISRAANDESKKAYWSGYGEDISYNWSNVYGMTNHRLTVLYSKGKSKINQLEIYNEDVLAYYTRNNKVDTSLVLKADVVAYTEMVVKFSYK